jgi:hypothetical protein
MNGFSRHSVVDQMTAELAERRHTAHCRRAAYVALAQAILCDETELGFPISLDRQPIALDRSPVAA